MRLDEAASALGLGAVVGWLGKWLVSREKRLATQAKSDADLERERVRVTGETRVAEMRSEETVISHYRELLRQSERRAFNSQQGHMETLAHLENQKAENDALRREVAFRDDVIDQQSALMQRAHDALEASCEMLLGMQSIIRDLTLHIERSKTRSEPPASRAE